MTSTAFQDALSAITDPAVAQVAASLATQRADYLRQTVADADASLRTVIGQRVAALRTASDQAGAFQTSESARAATVTAATPDVTVAYLTLIRDELALIHNDLALVAGSQVIGLTATADLATVVSNNI